MKITEFKKGHFLKKNFIKVLDTTVYQLRLTKNLKKLDKAITLKIFGEDNKEVLSSIKIKIIFESVKDITFMKSIEVLKELDIEDYLTQFEEMINEKLVEEFGLEVICFTELFEKKETFVYAINPKSNTVKTVYFASDEDLEKRQELVPFNSRTFSHNEEEYFYREGETNVLNGGFSTELFLLNGELFTPVPNVADYVHKTIQANITIAFMNEDGSGFVNVSKMVG